jgi:hypothetical protein
VTTDLLWPTLRQPSDRVGSIGRVRASGIDLRCRYQRCSRVVTSGFDVVPADNDISRSLKKAEGVTADGAYAAGYVIGPVCSSESSTKGGFK